MLLFTAAAKAARRGSARPGSLDHVLPVTGMIAAAVRLFRYRQATETRPEAEKPAATVQQPLSNRSARDRETPKRLPSRGRVVPRGSTCAEKGGAS